VPSIPQSAADAFGTVISKRDALDFTTPTPPFTVVFADIICGSYSKETLSLL
jgi:hypothetical protein